MLERAPQSWVLMEGRIHAARWMRCGVGGWGGIRHVHLRGESASMVFIELLEQSVDLRHRGLLAHQLADIDLCTRMRDALGLDWCPASCTHCVHPVHARRYGARHASTCELRPTRNSILEI